MTPSSLQDNAVPLLSGGKDAKSLIVRVLSREFPLTAKQVFNKIRKHEPAVTLTYQAVHKALGLLESDDVVSDSGGAFQLSEKWISGVKEFGVSTERLYHAGAIPDVRSLSVGETVSFRFPTLLDSMYWFIQEEYADYLANPVPDACIPLWRHLFPITQTSADEFHKLHSMFSKGIHAGLVSSDTPLDRFLKGYWEKLGHTFILGYDHKALYDTIIHRDLVFEFSVSAASKAKIEKLFAGKGRDVAASLEDYSAILASRESAPLFRVTRDPEVCKTVAKQYLPLFER